MSLDNLPVEWEKSYLNDVINVIRGITYKKQDASDIKLEKYLPVLRANSIQNGQMILDDLVYINSALIKDDQLIKKHDIIVAMSSGSKNLVGKSAIAKEDIDAGFGAFCAILRPCKLIDPKYVGLFTFSIDYRNKISELSAGANINNLKPSHFSDIPFPIPPLAEQQEIVRQLDVMLAQVEQIKARLDAIPAILKKFRQSVLADAVSGKLTEEWRGTSELIGWHNKTLGDIAIVKTGKTPSRKESKYWENASIPWLTSSATGNNFTDSADEFISDVASKECNLTPFPKGTLLLAMYGEGKTRGQVTELLIEATCNQACAAILVNKEIAHTSFVKIRLLENYEVIRKAASGGNQPNLNLNKVREIDISLPTLDEQFEILNIVKSLFVYADKIEETVQSAQKRVNLLTQSILAKAFSGELTAEWREQHHDLITGVNSAEALLAKIQKEREASKPVKKAKKVK